VAERQYDPQVQGTAFSTRDLETRERLMEDTVNRARTEVHIEGVPVEVLQRDEVGELFLDLAWVRNHRSNDTKDVIEAAVKAGRVIRIDNQLEDSLVRALEQMIARCSAEHHERLAAEARKTLAALGG
jgi:hypothetical protein